MSDVSRATGGPGNQSGSKLLGTQTHGERHFDDTGSVLSEDDVGRYGDIDRAAFDQALLGVIGSGHDEEMMSSQGPLGYESDGSERDSQEYSDRSAEERMETRAREYGELAGIGNRLMKASAMQMANIMRKARFANNSPRRGGEVKQLVFGLEGSELVDSLETANGLYERLMQGRVVTQVVARTGIGKTTRFAGLIASKCGARVLLLEPDVLLAAAAADRLRAVSKVRTRWLRQREESVTCMTYADFCGHFQTNGGAKLMEQFDVVLMDEAHIPMAEVFAAKAIFATRAGETGPSLLVLSATIDGQDSQAINNSAPVRELRGSLMDALRAGSLTSGSRAADRTLLIVATDEEVADACEYIEEQGHVAYMLDSASRTSDYWAVLKNLKQPSVNKRYLVVTGKFGTGANFPVSQVYLSGVRVVYELDGNNEVHARRVGVTVSERKQHAARVNRGMVAGSSAFAFNECEPMPDVELLESERVKAYLYLRAAGIKPLKTYLPSAELFPFGVTPEVASNVLAVNLPCELAIRFFNSDGCVSPNFARALRPFSHVQHYYITSPLPSPIAYEAWQVVKTGGFYSMAVASQATVKVPYDVADDELRAKLHVVAALAQGRIDIDDFIPRLSDGETSEEEVVQEPMRVSRRMPRLVADADRPLPPAPRALPWGFDAPLEDQLTFRQRPQPVYGADTYAGAVMRSLKDAETVLTFPTGQFTEVTDSNGVVRTEVRSSVMEEESSPVEFRSPKGTVVVSMRKAIWERLLEGEALFPEEAVSLMRSIRHNTLGFARSDAFSNWNNAWIGVLRTLQSRANLSELQKRNLMQSTAAMMLELYNRYTTGVQNVTSRSYVKAKFWSRVLSGRSVEEQIARDEDRGKLEIIQSKEFFRRVYEIREHSILVLHEFERLGWFTPEVKTRIQDVLPIMGQAIGREDDKVLRVTRGQSSTTVRRLSGNSSVVSNKSWRARMGLT